MRFSLSVCGALAAVALTAPAYAVDYRPGDVDASGSEVFSVTPVGGTVFTAPTISGSIKLDGLPSGTFTDRFLFTIPQNGVGSGSLTTSTSLPLGNVTDLDFLTVTFNGVAVPILKSPDQTAELASLSNLPITSLVENILSVTYTSRGNGSFGGQLTFRATPSVPEPATWALFLAGFGVLGFALRRKSKDGVRVRYAF